MSYFYMVVSDLHNILQQNIWRSISCSNYVIFTNNEQKKISQLVYVCGFFSYPNKYFVKGKKKKWLLETINTHTYVYIYVHIFPTFKISTINCLHILKWGRIVHNIRYDLFDCMYLYSHLIKSFIMYRYLYIKKSHE